MKKPDFQLAEIDTRIFTYDRNLQLMCADLSDIQANAAYTCSLTARVYNDACDQGFYVRSHRTGRRVLLVLEREVRDAEGDLRCWHFVPAEEIPGLQSINVFND
jgi:hypothetical protein